MKHPINRKERLRIKQLKYEKKEEKQKAGAKKRRQEELKDQETENELRAYDRDFQEHLGE